MKIGVINFLFSVFIVDVHGFNFLVNVRKKPPLAEEKVLVLLEDVGGYQNNVYRS